MRAKKSKSSMEKLKDGGFRIWHVAVIALLFAAMIWAVIYSYNNRRGIGTEPLYDAYENDLILNGVFAESVNIGGLTKKQAEDKINREYVEPKTSVVLTFCYEDYSKDYTKGELGLGFNVKEVIDKAYKTGRSGSKVERIAYASELADMHEFIAIEQKIDEGSMKAAIDQISDDIAKMGAKVDKEGIKAMIDDNMANVNEDSILTVPVK